MRSAIALVLLACSDGTKSGGDSEAADTATDTTDTDTTEDTAVLNDPYIDGRACPENSSVTWQSFGQGFLLDHCVGCHSENLDEASRAGAPLGVDFNTQALAQTWLARIYARSGDDNTTMPPVDSISPTDRVLLGDWLACGAL